MSANDIATRAMILSSAQAVTVLTVVERADDGVLGVADVPGVGMPRPVGPGGALVGAVTAWSGSVMVPGFSRRRFGDGDAGGFLVDDRLVLSEHP